MESREVHRMQAPSPPNHGGNWKQEMEASIGSLAMGYVCMYGPSVVTALTTVHRTAPQTHFLLTLPAPSPPDAATHSCVLGRWAAIVYMNVKTLLIIIIIAQQHIPSFSRMSFSIKG